MCNENKNRRDKEEHTEKKFNEGFKRPTPKKEERPRIEPNKNKDKNNDKK